MAAEGSHRQGCRLEERTGLHLDGVPESFGIDKGCDAGLQLRYLFASRIAPQWEEFQ